MSYRNGSANCQNREGGGGVDFDPNVERLGSGDLPRINERSGSTGDAHQQQHAVRRSTSAGRDGHDEALRLRSALKSAGREVEGNSRPASKSTLRTPSVRPRTADKHVAFPVIPTQPWDGSLSRAESGVSMTYIDGEERDISFPMRQSVRSPASPLRGVSSRMSTAGSTSSLKRLFKFGVDDFVRAQDAKMGMEPLYNHAKVPLRPGSTRPGTSTSSMSAKSHRGSGRGSRANTGGGGGRGEVVETEYQKAQREQAERVAKEDARKKELQDKLMVQKMAQKLAAVRLCQAYMRWKITKIGFHPKVQYWTGLTIFLNKYSCTWVMYKIYARHIRKLYEARPPITENVQFFFPDVDNSTLEANWECQKARIYMDDSDTFLANEAVGWALLSLHKAGMCEGITKADMFRKFFSKGGDIRKEQALANPFCATPGCSRRPFKMCEWDQVSKICDEHAYTATWDKDAGALVYGKRHQMNVAVPSRRDYMWCSFLLGLHPRLGGDKACHIAELLLPRGSDQGGELVLLEHILELAWTVTVPDEYDTVPEAVAAVPDQSVIVVRRGLHTWHEPLEVRKRINVVGEQGSLLMGTWVLDDCSGGGAFRGVTCVAYGSGRCVEARGGKWLFEECLLRGGGDGVTVVSAVNSSQLVMRDSVVCGMPSDHAGDIGHPWGCVHLGGAASLEIQDGMVRDAAGYGIDVCDTSSAVIKGLRMANNSRAALRMEKAVSVELEGCDFRDNGACIDCQGHALPHQAKRFDPLRLELFVQGTQEHDCLRMVGNTIRGALFATSHRPTFLLGSGADRYGIDRGDIMLENTFLPGSHCPPLRRKTGTGNEMFSIMLPDNSSLKCNDGSDFIESYVRQRWEMAHLLTAPLKGWTKRAKALVFHIENISEARSCEARARGYSVDEWGVFTGSRAPTSLTQLYGRQTAQTAGTYGDYEEFGDNDYDDDRRGQQDFWWYEDVDALGGDTGMSTGIAAGGGSLLPPLTPYGGVEGDAAPPSTADGQGILRAVSVHQYRRPTPALEALLHGGGGESTKTIRFSAAPLFSDSPKSVAQWGAAAAAGGTPTGAYAEGAQQEAVAGGELLGVMVPTPTNSILRQPSSSGMMWSGSGGGPLTPVGMRGASRTVTSGEGDEAGERHVGVAEEEVDRIMGMSRRRRSSVVALETLRETVSETSLDATDLAGMFASHESPGQNVTVRVSHALSGHSDAPLSIPR